MMLTLATGLLLATASATTFSTAGDLKVALENLVVDQAEHLQGYYEAIAETEGTPSCPTPLMCDADAFDGAAQLTQFLDADGTCTNLDLDEDGETLRDAVTGRQPDVRSACDDEDVAKWGSVMTDPSTDDVYVADVTKGVYLQSTGCLGGDTGECTVDTASYGINFPDGADSGSVRLAAEVCATNTLEPSLRTAQQEHEQLGWQFLGLQETGLYRSYPSLYQCRTEAQCSGCSDPRFRGWYASAASGPKDVVIVLDTSGSMSVEDRITKMKTAAGWVVNTLTSVDRAAIVSYSSNADAWTAADITGQATTGSLGDAGTGKLAAMTPLNRALAKQYIADLGAFGQTNMADGFDLAFDILDDSKDDPDATTGCSRIVLFLTDGVNSGEDPTALIRDRNGGEDWSYDNAMALLEGDYARIFTYSFGDDSDTSLMKQIACNNAGIWQRIADSDGDNLKTIMASYFVYLAAGIVPDDKAPTARWVDPYEDGQGRGPMTAACSPVYDYVHDPPLLFGVTCAGVSDAVLHNLDGYDAAWANVAEERAECPGLTFTWEQLEALRATIAPDSACEYVEPDDDASAIIIGLVVIIVGFLCVIGCCCALVAKNQQQSQQQQLRGQRHAEVVQPQQPMVMMVTAQQTPGMDHYAVGATVPGHAVR